MEGKGGSQGEQLVSELCRVQGLVRQLELHLQAPDAGSVEHCRRLAAQIVALTDRSIAFVTAAAMTPRSGTASPLSDVSHQQQPFRQPNPKKRKATARWTSQVRVSAAGGAEGPGEDGHSWRKYGQKDILGAKHPRGYYRCTHRNSQGCAATKQVQRADHDPALFDVVYHGEHTCRASSTGAGAGSRIRPPPLDQQQQQQHNPHAQSLLQSLSAGLTVDTASLLHASSPMTPPSMASDSNGGLTPMSASYPVNAFTEWPLDCDLQEVVSALTAVSGPAPAMYTDDVMTYYFEFDPTFGADMPSLF